MAQPTSFLEMFRLQLRKKKQEADDGDLATTRNLQGMRASSLTVHSNYDFFQYRNESVKLRTSADLEFDGDTLPSIRSTDLMETAHAVLQ